MATAFVQFSDATNTDIVAVFCCAQDERAFPHQGEVDILDARYVAFSNAVPAGSLPYPSQ